MECLQLHQKRIYRHHHFIAIAILRIDDYYLCIGWDAMLIAKINHSRIKRFYLEGIEVQLGSVHLVFVILPYQWQSNVSHRLPSCSGVLVSSILRYFSCHNVLVNRILFSSMSSSLASGSNKCSDSCMSISICFLPRVRSSISIDLLSMSA